VANADGVGRSFGLVDVNVFGLVRPGKKTEKLSVNLHLTTYLFEYDDNLKMEVFTGLFVRLSPRPHFLEEGRGMYRFKIDLMASATVRQTMLRNNITNQ
jgi:hypothetical protein